MAFSKEGLLAGMSNMAPQQNQQAAQALGSQAGFQAKQAAGQAYMGGQPLGKQQTSQLATQQAGQTAQANLSAAQSTVQQQGQIGQTALFQQGQANKQALGERQLGLQKKQRELENSLATLNEKAKDEILGKNLSFQRDELGRTQWNERQLMDWKITQMKNTQELQAFKQQVMQVSARKMEYLKTLNAKLEQAIRQKAKTAMSEADNKTLENMMRLKYSTQTQMINEQRDAQRRMGGFAAAGTIAGTAIGAYAGGPMGAQMGGSVGGSVGTAVGSAFG